MILLLSINIKISYSTVHIGKTVCGSLGLAGADSVVSIVGPIPTKSVRCEENPRCKIGLGYFYAIMKKRGL